MNQTSEAAAVPSAPVMAAKVGPPRFAPGLVRPRLESALGQVWERRLALVVAPAGSGKTTLLSQFAASVAAPVAWYQAEASESSSGALLRHLGASFNAALGPIGGEWGTVEGAVHALEGWSGERAVLVVDDLHHLEGTPAEAALQRLLAYAPPGVVLVGASRYPPRFNLPRLRVGGALVEIGPEDLRFRVWEVERLFRDHYGEALFPDETASLARRTEGWAAGLQLFHLATSGKPVVERRQLLEEMASRSRLVREYLTRNVLEELRPELRQFLVQTCVLGRLSGPLCDRLLERTGSHVVLAEMERRRIFTSSLDDSTYRYHEVLRSVLDEILVEQHGEDEARAAHRRAALLLEDHGALPEALRAYCRAEDWHAAARLLGGRGEEIITVPGDWVEGLPLAFALHDPWLLLSAARRHVLAGRFGAAVEAFRQAEPSFEGETAIGSCRRECRDARAWSDPAPRCSDSWIGVVRSSTIRRPLAAANAAHALSDPPGRLAEGVALLLAGHIGAARGALDAVGDSASPLVLAGARLAVAVTSLLGGQRPATPELDWACEVLEANGLAWLSSLGRAVVADPQVARLELAGLRRSAASAHNPWAAAIAGLLAGLVELAGGERPATPLREVEEELRALGADVLANWAAAATALAMAREGDAGALHAARRTVVEARRLGCDGGALVATLAMAQVDLADKTSHLAEVESLARRIELDPSHLGDIQAPGGRAELDPAPERRDPLASTSSRAPVVALRCFGGFCLVIDGSQVDAAQVKPRARSALRLLAAHGGKAVHRELLVDALWPEVDLGSGVRNLQVAVSSLRQLLEPGVRRGESSMLVREADAYRLALPTGASVDVVDFERAVREARAGRAAGDLQSAEAALGAALLAYTGELLPEEGPAEWLVKLRDHYRMEATAAAHGLAELRLARGDTHGAVAAAEAGLMIDRYRDGLWHLLAAAHRKAGAHAAAARTEGRYRQALAELGMTDD